MLELRRVRQLSTFRSSLYGYWLFLIGLLLTAFGSSFYHLAPNNARLIWDRLPIDCLGLCGSFSGGAGRYCTPCKS